MSALKSSSLRSRTWSRLRKSPWSHSEGFSGTDRTWRTKLANDQVAGRIHVPCCDHNLGCGKCLTFNNEGYVEDIGIILKPSERSWVKVEARGAISRSIERQRDSRVGRFKIILLANRRRSKNLPSIIIEEQSEEFELLPLVWSGRTSIVSV